MNRSRLTSRLLKLLLTICAGGTLFTNSCGEDLRNSVRSAGLDFVRTSTSQALQELIPVKDIIAGEGA
jgi:hypothetical protein